jgi:hypothetical protein
MAFVTTIPIRRRHADQRRNTESGTPEITCSAIAPVAANGIEGPVAKKRLPQALGRCSHHDDVHDQDGGKPGGGPAANESPC